MEMSHRRTRVEISKEDSIGITNVAPRRGNATDGVFI